MTEVVMTSHTEQIDTPKLLTPDPHTGEPFECRPQPVRVLLMIGSTRRDRFGIVPATWAAEQARMRNDVEVDVVDLQQEDLPVVLDGDDWETPPPQSVSGFARRIDDADAVVIVTPVYNRGYPASLKKALLQKS